MFLKKKIFFFQAEDGMRGFSVTGVLTVLFRSVFECEYRSMNHEPCFESKGLSFRGPATPFGARSVVLHEQYLVPDTLRDGQHQLDLLPQITNHRPVPRPEFRVQVRHALPVKSYERVDRRLLDGVEVDVVHNQSAAPFPVPGPRFPPELLRRAGAGRLIPGEPDHDTASEKEH